MEGWSEVVPSHKATGVCEGRGAGANGLAAQRLGDIAVSLIVTVIHRAGLVLTEGRGLQSCGWSRGWGQQTRSDSSWGAPAHRKLLLGWAWFLSPQSSLSPHSASELL